MTTLVDTDALLALMNKNDALRTRALQVARELTARNATFHILPTTLAEFAILATIRVGFEQSKGALDFLMQRGFESLVITNAMSLDAYALYGAQTSKENSLFDCFVMVAARKYQVDCIFSFDGGYKQNNFMIAENYLSAFPAI